MNTSYLNSLQNLYKKQITNRPKISWGWSSFVCLILIVSVICLIVKCIQMKSGCNCYKQPTYEIQDRRDKDNDDYEQDNFQGVFKLSDLFGKQQNKTESFSSEYQDDDLSDYQQRWSQKMYQLYQESDDQNQGSRSITKNLYKQPSTNYIHVQEDRVIPDLMQIPEDSLFSKLIQI